MASTISQTHTDSSGKVRCITATVTFDSGTGAFTSTALGFAIEGRLLWLETNPGTTAPTDNYDITLVDADGADRLLGVGANRDTATTELVPIVYTSTSVHPVVSVLEALTWTIANNSVNSATVVIRLWYTNEV